jgi:uncharacterized protein YoaH (UPF0181 family)
MDTHFKQQQEAISEALWELMCNEDSCDQAHNAIAAAIDEWLSYHEKEVQKWRTLRGKVAAAEGWQ